jgi:hypothetical protein
MPSSNLPTTAVGEPKANAQRNFTAPDSHILKGGNGWIHGYNRHAAVDGDHQIIVAVGSAVRPVMLPIWSSCWSGSWPTPASYPRR